MQEKIEKYVREYSENSKRLVKEYRLAKILAWISLFLIFLTITFIIIKSSHAACPSGQVQNYQGNCVSINQAASEVNNPYSNSGGSSLSGLMSYGKNNISLTPSICTNSSNFLNVEYSVTSSGDINAVIQMNTNNGSGYNYSYSIPVLISGVCSNGIISCPAGEWYGGGITCNNYAIQYNPSTGFSLEPLGSAIMGTPQSTSVNVPLNGTQVSTVTSTQTSGGLADCIDINDATGTTPASETEVQQVLTDLGGQITSAIQKGSSDIIGGVSQNTASSPYSATYSGGTCNSSNYNSPSNLEGLYNQGGSALNNEVSSSEVSTANSNTQSALGLTSTPSSMLTTVQNNSFGGMSGGSCSIENQANTDSCTIAPDLVLTGSWNIGNYESNGCSGSCTCGSGSGSTDTTTLSSSGGGMNNVINGQPNNGGTPPSITGSLTFTQNGQIQGSMGLNTFGCGWSLPTCMYGDGNTIETSNSCSGSITYNPTTETFSGTINISTNTGTDTLSTSGNCITASQGGSICVQPDGSSPTCAGINIPTNNDGVFTNFTYYYVLYQRMENTCSTYQKNSNCTLLSKEVCNQDNTDCVTIMSNSNPEDAPPTYNWFENQTDTNYSPSTNIQWSITMNGESVQAVPSETNDTVDYSGNLATSSAGFGGNDYPYINETYECTGTPPYNFTAMNKQETAVTGSASMNSNNTAFSYTGVNGNQHNNISINNTVNNATQQECVVQQTTTNASVSSSVQATTATQNTPTSDTTTNTETLNCTNTGTINNPSWNCPVPKGYTIQTDCTAASNINNNNFAPAMVELQVLDKAGSSLICSAN